MAWSGEITLLFNPFGATSGDAQPSVTSGAHTPPADSLEFVQYSHSAVSHNAVPDVQLSNTGGLTFARYSTEVREFFSTNDIQGTLFVAPVGGSPSSMTVTIDPFPTADNAYQSMLVYAVTEGEILQGPVGRISENDNATTHTTAALDDPTTSGNLVLAGFSTHTTGSTVPTAPAGFTLLASTENNYQMNTVFYSTSHVGTTVTCTDLGESLYVTASWIVEIETPSVAVAKYTELEWNLKLQAPATTSDVYEFRVYAGASPLTDYAVTAQLSVATTGVNYNETGRSITIAASTTATDQADWKSNVGLSIPVVATTTATVQVDWKSNVALPIPIVATVTVTPQYDHRELVLSIPATAATTLAVDQADFKNTLLAVPIISDVTVSDSLAHGGHYDDLGLSIPISAGVALTDQADFKNLVLSCPTVATVTLPTDRYERYDLARSISIVTTVTTPTDQADFKELGHNLTAGPGLGLYADMAGGYITSDAQTSLPSQWIVSWRQDPALLTQLVGPAEYDWFVAYERKASGSNFLFTNYRGVEVSVGRPFNDSLWLAQYYALGFDPVPGLTHNEWTSPDGVNWTRVPGTPADVGAARAVTPSTMPIGFGRDGYGSSAKGRIYWIEMRTGLDPAAGSVLWRFDAAEYSGSATSFTDPRGRTWTLSTASAVVTETLPGAVATVTITDQADFKELALPVPVVATVTVPTNKRKSLETALAVPVIGTTTTPTDQADFKTTPALGLSVTAFVSCTDNQQSPGHYEDTDLPIVIAANVATVIEQTDYKDLARSIPVVASTTATAFKHQYATGLSLPLVATVAHTALHKRFEPLALPVTATVALTDQADFKELTRSVTVIATITLLEGAGALNETGRQILITATVNRTDRAEFNDLVKALDVIAGVSLTDQADYHQLFSVLVMSTIRATDLQRYANGVVLNTALALYLGDAPVQKVYCGSVKVWP